jgi:hypothetical protein
MSVSPWLAAAAATGPFDLCPRSAPDNAPAPFALKRAPPRAASNRPKVRQRQLSPGATRVESAWLQHLKVTCDEPLATIAFNFHPAPLDQVGSAWLQRLKIKYDEPHLNFAFNFNLRHYTKYETLAPGLVIIREYLSMDQQKEILATVAELGQGTGGFYTPR